MRRHCVIRLFFAAGIASAASAAELPEWEARFLEVCQDRLRVVDESFAERAGEGDVTRLWLVLVEPKAAGLYTLTHDVKNPPGNRMYGRCTRIYTFDIAQENAVRLHIPVWEGPGTSPLACLGDRVVITIDISPRYSDHQFQLTCAEAKPQAVSARKKPNDATVVNSLSDCLQSVGSENGQILDRAGERIPYVKTFFEAKRPAKFNLRIYEDTARDRAQEMSIVILPRDQRLNVFLDDARLTDYGPGGSSATSWNVLGREALVLRVGDVLETGVLVQRGETEQTPRRIICARLPFDPHGKFVHDHVKWKDY